MTRVCTGFVEFLISILHRKRHEKGKCGRESGGNTASASTEGIELQGSGEIAVSDPSPRPPRTRRRRKKKLAVGAGKRGG